MRYYTDLDRISMSVASIDCDSIEDRQELFRDIQKKHIYVRDAVSWYQLPDDGLERQQTMRGADAMLVFDN